jgi:two-component system, NarL family, response regulator LiaR
MFVSQTESAPNTPESQGIKILIADDHPLMRQAIRLWLEKQSDFKVIAEASDGDEAVKLALEYIPDVVIMDINMPGLNGLEATKLITQKCSSINILALTVYDDSEHILGILKAGASGYLTKKVSGEEIVQAVRSLVAGETVLSHSISKKLIEYSYQNANPSVPVNIDRLNSREIDIIKLVARGVSNKEIALMLDLSLRSVKAHLTNIYLKLNVNSRTEAIATCLRKGVINVSDVE